MGEKEVFHSIQAFFDTCLFTIGTTDVTLENPEILRNPEPDVHLREFGDSSWNIKLRICIDNPKRHPVVRSDINCATVRKFRENGVEIPFPQRNLPCARRCQRQYWSVRESSIKQGKGQARGTT